MPKKDNPLRQLPADMQNYRDNKIQRLDIDILKRLCYVLDCDLYELIEYIPPSDKEN